MLILFYRARVVEIPFFDLYGPFADLEVRKPDFKGGFLLNTQFITVQSITTKGIYKNHFLNEYFFTSHYGLSFPTNHFLYDIMSKKIVQLKSTGIIDNWKLPWFKSRYSIDIEPETGPKVLSLKHLGIGFKVCMFMLSLSFVVFIFELMINRALKYFRKSSWNVVWINLLHNSWTGLWIS